MATIDLFMFLCGVLVSVLELLFLLGITIQIGYALSFFGRIFSVNNSRMELKNESPVSVIICAKNEAENLRQNLPAILSQRYMNDAGNPLYEVIVVDDASTDHTSLVLLSVQQEYPNLKIVNIAANEERLFKGKKFALSKGVAAAENDFLVMTDADCVPVSDSWLQFMVAPLAEGKEIVAGYGKFKEHEGMLNSFIRWETMHTFLQYTTYALNGFPYMAVGRNIACTKQVFEKAITSDAWNELPSGDDDLLVNAAATKDNIAIVVHKDSFTLSMPKADFPDWVSQKQRHLSTGKYYKSSVKALLSLYASSHALIWLLFITLLVIGDAQMVLLAMAFRCCIYWFIWLDTSMKLKEKRLFSLYPVMDFAWMIYNFGFAPYILWKNKKQWK